ncbi:MULTISPECIES: LysR family transcriptional regulator [unclassified Neptuniibacter]|uniref:LysR family transcriptional regulator n=1 Tax=unclassified Neptuniibacter TaxID=2630693 RepID=UPI0025E6D455|nr:MULTISPECIES: LysR family transcriptional regulator [unclassified Neptuniibacter]|tara:strand:+ start:6231 stop:7109 length:879 start_codon:yes stop_codon:yes gene_type:complete
MDISLLRTFLEVSKTRHFGQAADNLYLTQSAVSSRIKQLEDLVGAPLFLRQRHNIMLTIAGERLIPHAENLLASWQLALQDVGLHEQQEMHLSLGGISNLWGTFLQSALPKIAESFPLLSIRTKINSHVELTQALIGNRLDMAVLLDPPNISELKTTRIGQIELALVSNKEGIKFGEIDELGYIFVDWGTAFNLKHAKLFKKPVTPTLHTEQSQIALEFLLTNGGAAFLPLSQLATYLEEKQLYLVEGVKPVKRSVYAVYSKNSPDHLYIKQIIELLNEVELKPEAVLQPTE